MSFSQGDYTYSLVLQSKTLSSVTLSYRQSYTYTLSPTPVSEANDEDTFIHISVLDHEEGDTSFKAGTTATGYCRSVHYSYNGAASLTVTCYSEEESSTISGSFSYYNNGGVRAVATDKTKATYSNIPSSVTNGGTTYSVTSLKECFYNCTLMTTFPTVPNTVTNYYDCFARCSSLSGSFNVPDNRSIEDTSSMFYLTSGNIFLVTNYATGTSDHTALKNIWQPIASRYSNVYFEADGNPIHTADVVLSRVDDTTGEDDPEGESVKIDCTIQWTTSKLPANWSTSYTISILLDSTTTLTNPEWTTTNNRITGTIEKYALGDSLQHTVSITAIQTIKDTNNNIKMTRSAADVETLSSVFAIFDFYPGGHGLAIGSVANSEGLTVSIESNFDSMVKINNTAGFRVNSEALSGDDYTIRTALPILGWSGLLVQNYLYIKELLVKIIEFLSGKGSDSKTYTDWQGYQLSATWSWRKWPDGTFDLWYRNEGEFAKSAYSSTWATWRVSFDFPDNCKPVNTNYLVFATWGINSNSTPVMQSICSGKSKFGFSIEGLTLTDLNYNSRPNSFVDVYVHGNWK